MEQSSANNMFIIVNVNAHVYDYNIVNDARLFKKDRTDPDLGKDPIYISPNNEQRSKISAHVVLVISIEIGTSGDGTITYINPLARTQNGSNRRYVKYSTFLNSTLLSAR